MSLQEVYANVAIREEAAIIVRNHSQAMNWLL